jgi:MFS family permease
MVVALMHVISFFLVFQIKEAHFRKEKAKTFREYMSAVFSVRGLNTDVYRISFSWFFRSLGSSFGEGFILILFLSKILHAQPSIIGLTRAGAYILYAVPSLFFSKFVLRWMKAWSNRKVYVTAFLFSSLFMFLIGCANDPLQVTVFYAILGIIEGFSIIPQMTFFSTSSKELIGKSFGISTLIRSFGSLLGGMVAPVLASTYGFRPMFTISAIFQIITILPIIIKRPIVNKPQSKL